MFIKEKSIILDQDNMKLKYAVVSSNSNPEYLDFWPYVAKAWKSLIELEPILLYIDENEPPEWVHEHGKVYYFKALKEWSIVQQAQCIRFWAARILDEPFIISDLIPFFLFPLFLFPLGIFPHAI